MKKYNLFTTFTALFLSIAVLSAGSLSVSASEDLSCGSTEETTITANSDSVFSEYLEELSSSSSRTSSASNTEETDAFRKKVTGQDVVDYALQYVGNPYVYGGTSLTNGADCSGFVMAVFAHFDIELPHYSGAQMEYGTAVEESALEPGDLVFYGAGGSQHVAIYMGNDQIVHAANSRTGIAVTEITWSGTPVGYRRLI